MTGGARATAWVVVPSPRRVRAALAPPGALALLVLAVVAPSPAAELWQWTDAEGVVRYTNDPETIPPAFRGGARDVGSPQPRPSTPSAPAGTPPALPVPAGTAVLPTEAGAPIKAPASLNGVSLALIVDTGADRTVLSPAAVARAGLDTTRAHEIGIVGLTGRATARALVVERFEVAGRPVGPLTVIIHEVDVPDADGLLGRDVLDHFTLTVDPGASRAVLTPR